MLKERLIGIVERIQIQLTSEVVVGMRLVGALLVTSLIIFPPLTAMRVCKKFRSVVVLSGILSALSFIIGMMISVGVPSAPVGASVVLVNAGFFVVFFVAGKVSGRLRKHK